MTHFTIYAFVLAWAALAVRMGYETSRFFLGLAIIYFIDAIVWKFQGFPVPAGGGSLICSLCLMVWWYSGGGDDFRKRRRKLGAKARVLFRKIKAFRPPLTIPRPVPVPG
jgi:hypothetical protein